MGWAATGCSTALQVTALQSTQVQRPSSAPVRGGRRHTEISVAPNSRSRQAPSTQDPGGLQGFAQEPESRRPEGQLGSEEA